MCCWDKLSGNSSCMLSFVPPWHAGYGNRATGPLAHMSLIFWEQWKESIWMCLGFSGRLCLKDFSIYVSGITKHTHTKQKGGGGENNKKRNPWEERAYPLMCPSASLDGGCNLMPGMKAHWKLIMARSRGEGCHSGTQNPESWIDAAFNEELRM